MKRWKHLRDAFVKGKKKDEDSKQSGSQAIKKRKYIFNDELQFLAKIYSERSTEESFSNEDGYNKDEDDVILEEQEDSVQLVPTKVATVAETSATGIKKPAQVKRARKKLDEVDLKIIKAIENSQKEIKQDSKLSFFQSLLPHVNKFNDNEWLQCQVDFLQVISKINNRNPSPAPSPRHHDLYNQSTSQLQVPSQHSNFNYLQPPFYGQMHHQAHSSSIIDSQVSHTHAVQQFQPVQVAQVPNAVQPQVPQVPNAVQPKNHPATSQSCFPQAPKVKSPATAHYESCSKLFDDDDDLSCSSNATVDFTQL